MTSRYEKRFADIKAKMGKTFMPFTVLGWPDRGASLALIKQMIDGGASALELGFAFSDPVADGPLIQKADFDTLASGFTVDMALALIAEVRAYDAEIPIGVLIYYNLILAHGPEKFFQDARAAGIDGVLVADLPVDSASEIAPFAQANDIAQIFLVSPVTADQRLDLITSKASGFIYLLSRLGVTGTAARSASSDQTLAALVKRIKSRTTVPVIAGFGVSSPSDAAVMFAAGCDGVISGSKIIELAASPDGAAKLDHFYKAMLAAASYDTEPKALS
ncbi:MAG: tryptophan synthase subunit alpha [Cyanobacteria bacterium REEB67]|nr:tryptophan synthase subunit alpha [Cyanobacteria bacterium REEB67]